MCTHTDMHKSIRNPMMMISWNQIGEQVVYATVVMQVMISPSQEPFEEKGFPPRSQENNEINVSFHEKAL
jgi:hypothetical protein